MDIYVKIKQCIVSVGLWWVPEKVQSENFEFPFGFFLRNAFSNPDFPLKSWSRSAYPELEIAAVNINSSKTVNL